MKPRTVWPGLASLSRRFEATFPGDEIEALFPEGAGRRLIRRGILVDAGCSSTIPHCICNLKRPSCIVRVDGGDAGLFGYCNEYGVPVEVSLDQVRRYHFSCEAWAEGLREANALEGAGPVRGAGCLFLGTGNAAKRTFGLLLVAPGCRRTEDVVFPKEAHLAARPLLGLYLGSPIAGLAVDVALSVQDLGPDLVTVEPKAIARGLAQTPSTPGFDQAWPHPSVEVNDGGLVDDAWYSPSQLAAAHNVDSEALRKRLGRFRHGHMDGWKDNDDRRAREPRHLYQLKQVRGVIESLRAAGKRPANVRRKSSPRPR
jgi:hypothetical protein